MSSDWEDFRAVRGRDPLTARGELQRDRYAGVDGAGTPPGWRVSEWITPFEETPFYEAYEDHVEDGMELTILLSDYHAMRGTGKTTLSIKLARQFDRTPEGLTPEKVTNSPEEFIDAYVRHAQGSGLVFDEAESGLNTRDAMTKVNKEMNEKVSMGRVGEKYAIWNMPDINQIDKQIRKLGHYWVLVQRLGRARVYKLSNNPFEDKTYTRPICELEFSALPESDAVYQRLDEHKWDRLTGEGEQYVPAEEVAERVERAEREAKQELRNEFIASAYDRQLLSQAEIAEIVDMSQSRVSQICREMKQEAPT